MIKNLKEVDLLTYYACGLILITPYKGVKYGYVGV